MNKKLALSIFIFTFLWLGSARPAWGQEWNDNPDQTPTETPMGSPTIPSTLTPTQLPSMTPIFTPIETHPPSLSPTSTMPPPESTPTPTMPPPAPTPTLNPLEISSVEPALLYRGEGGIITIIGEGFEEGMSARLVGYGLLDTTCANRNMAKASVPASTPAGLYSLQVVRIDGETASIEAGLTILEPAVTIEPPPSPSPTPDMRLPALLVCGARASSNQIRPGEEFSLTLDICNAGGLGVADGMILLDSLGLVPTGDKGHSFGEIQPGGSVSVSQKLRVPSSAAAGISMVDITIQANDVKGVLHSFQGSTSVEVIPKQASSGGAGGAQLPRLVLLSTETNPTEVGPGSEVEFSFRIMNMGGKASQVLFRVVPDAVAAPVRGSESVLIETVPEGAEVVVTMPMVVRAHVQPGYYESALHVEFSGIGGQTGTLEIRYGLEIAVDVSNRPQLAILEYLASPDFISQGDLVELRILVSNFGGIPARQAVINLGGNPENLRPFSPIGSGNVRYLANIEPGETVEVSFTLIVDGKAEARAYNLPVDLAYLGDNDSEYLESQVISLLVQNRPFFQTGFYREVSFGTVGQQIRLPIEVANLSTARFNVLSIMVSSQQIDFTTNEAFVGKLESGGVFSMDAAGVPLEAGQAEIAITVTYLDDFNQPQTITKILTLEIRERNLPQTPTQEQVVEAYPTENFWQTFLRFVRGLFGLGS